MKIKTLTILLALLAFIPLLASAHTFKDDGQITVLMHTDPDDDVLAGAPASVDFSVFDQTNQFQAADCDCAVQISSGNQTLLRTALTPTDSASSIFSYEIPFTFPKKADYQIAILGAPKIGGEFQSFQITFDLPVTQEAPALETPKNSSSDVSWIIAILVVAGVITLSLRGKISYTEEK